VVFENITGVRMSLEVRNNEYKYEISGGEGDEINVEVFRDYCPLATLKTYLWYFDVKDFNELKRLDKEKVINIIERQLSEKYFRPISYNEVRQYVISLINNTIETIDETIEHVKNRLSVFTSPIKDIAEIDCIFRKECKVVLELDETPELSAYYSLIGTNEGHIPVPLFLNYVDAETDYFDEERAISIVKNIIYFIRGYGEMIPEYERDYSTIGDFVRGAVSEIFQKAIVLYNKLIQNKNSLWYSENDEYYQIKYNDDDEEGECPQGTLPDGIGYCRSFNYELLMQKTEDELVNEIIDSLLKIRERMVKNLETMVL
jgi:hypothetical protein